LLGRERTKETFQPKASEHHHQQQQEHIYILDAYTQWITMEAPQASNDQHESQDAAYYALERMFSANIDKVLDIEILPSSADVPKGHIFFEDELGVGIPKKALVAAFVKAREIFAARSTNLEYQSYEVSFRDNIQFIHN
jgi:hypothetical protein